MVDAARFVRSGGIGAEVRDQVSDDRVLELFADGCTLVLQGMHRVWPPLVDFGGALSEELGHPVQVNAYVTPPQSRGFSAHYDTHDVFVLQVAGDKRWVIHEPVVTDPLPEDMWTRHADAVAAAHRDRTPALDVVLGPGDALYLPRGWLHSAEAQGSVSAHLTVGVHPVTRHQVDLALLAEAAAEPALRASLPLGVDLADADAGGAEVAAAAADLADRLLKVDTAAVLERVRQRAWAGTRPGPIGPLAQASAARAVSGRTRVRRRDALRWAVRRDGERLVLQLADRAVTLPVDTESALRAALQGGAVAVADLPGLDAEARLTLARRLLHEAVVVPVEG